MTTIRGAALIGAAIIFVGFSAAASAGGFNGHAGGMKSSIYDGIPVPAPSPIPVYNAEWYVRADLGYAFSTNDAVSSTGVFSFNDYGTHEGPMAVTLGFGRYVTPSLRAEFALDIRNEYKLGKSAQNYTGVVTEAATLGPAGPGGTNRHYYAATRSDTVRIGNYTGMVNLYYDFNNRSRFTPYVGGGAGLVVHTLKRNHTESAVCTFSTNDTGAGEVNYVDAGGNNVCASTGIAPGPVDPQLTPNYNSTSNQVNTGYGMAANAMVGMAYDMGDGWQLDFNYRYTWMGGKIKLTSTALNGSSSVNLGDVTEHALRAGVRMDIN